MLGNKVLGFKDMGRKEVGFYGAYTNYQPKGAEGSKPIGEEEQPAFPSKAKITVSSEEKSRLTREEEADPFCKTVYQRRFQPLVKAKWKVKEGKREGSSNTSATGSSPVAARKVDASGEVVDEGVIGGPATAPKAMIIGAGESGSCSEGRN